MTRLPLVEIHSVSMQHFFLTLLLLGLALCENTKASSLYTAAKGITLNAGALGEFTLAYPSLLTGSGEVVHKLVEAKANGSTANLRYSDGCKIEAILSGEGEVTLTLSNVPADVKKVTLEMLLDIAFNRGGNWRIGDAAKPFPAEKPVKPHLYQGNADSLTVSNAQGRGIKISAPQYSFLELTDNREWNWSVYAFKIHTPLTSERSVLKLRLVEVQPSNGTAKKLVDLLGQSTLSNWPQKMSRAEELKTDISADEAFYSSIKTPERDEFGGLSGSREKIGLTRTGFFHIDQRVGKSWLVDPAGNAFFHIGVCGFNPSDDYTYTNGREEIYEWLPPSNGEYKTAFREGSAENFSFYVANTIRKFGQPHDPDLFAVRMIERVRKFGFNSMGAFTTPPPTAGKKATFPYVLSLPINEWEGIPRIPGAWEVFDPFDENVCSLIERQLAAKLPALANDPLLIGWFIINEPRYDELPKVIPSLDGSHACKQAFVKFLEKKYGTIASYNEAWKANAASFAELTPHGLAVTTDAARADVKAFIGEFLEASFSLISTNFRRHDPNHLLLGSRLQPVTIDDEQLCRIEGRHVDVVSFNYYTYAIDKTLLARVHEWSGGRPMMLSEFFWSSPRDSGLTGGRELKSQQERGLSYRNYVEQAASLGFVIGIEWFTLIDQATTGRWFSKYSGESANTGLFSVVDRPWKPMLEEMAKTNHGIYELLLGQSQPFIWSPEKAKP